ncbi:putative isochorismatase hydrolase [Lyophyllum shimeji]|uniref:nicotinamidase n=1 Tax=Lyophyllum shimeji TaxID=47721 RepID=A0A9P3ULX5_LYOSH|nr:putative isochorismatase hydrolase [Lyophyllum shimeji]
MSTTDSTFTPALVVIDMQYDFVYGSLAVPGGSTIIDTINSLLKCPFAIKLASKDFHPADHISFAKTHDKPVLSKIIIYPPGKPLNNRPLEQVLWPVHCVANTPGFEFVEGLDREALDYTVHKGTDPGIETYSAFRDPWHLANTSLHGILESHGVTDVFVVGVAGDFCVKWTALDAVNLGYKTWVVRDAVKSVSDAGTEWEEMKNKGVRITNSDEVKKLVTG